MLLRPRSVLVVFLLVSASTAWSGVYSEEQLRQRREWQVVQDHYSALEYARSSASRAGPTWRQSQSSGTSELATWYSARKEREQQATAARNQAIEAAQRAVAESRAERAAAVARAQEPARRLGEQRADAEREARRRAWREKLKTDPFMPAIEPPAFSSVREEYYWYRELALFGKEDSGADPYAALLAVKMALDAECCNGVPDIRTALQLLPQALPSSLRYCLASDILATNQGGPQYITNILDGYHIATRLKDKTGGSERAYGKLLALYRAGTLFGQPVPQELSFVADVYAYAARNGDDRARADLKKLLAANMDAVASFHPWHLLNIAETFSLSGPEANYGLFLWYELGKSQQAEASDACFDSFMKCFIATSAQPSLRHAMMAHLHFLGVSEKKFADRLTREQQDAVLAGADQHVSNLEQARASGQLLQPADLELLFAWYSGQAGQSVDSDKAVAAAVGLAIEQNFSALKKAAIAFRLGRGGWPQDDARAKALFETALIPLNGDTGEARTKRATFLAEIADYWKGDANLGLRANDTEREECLRVAASLDAAYAYDYALWRAEPGLLHSPQIAARQAQMAEAYLDGLRAQMVSAGLSATTLDDKIAVMKKLRQTSE